MKKDNKKVNRPDLLVGHMAKSKKEAVEDAVITIVLAILIGVVYVLYIVG